MLIILIEDLWFYDGEIIIFLNLMPFHIFKCYWVRTSLIKYWKWNFKALTQLNLLVRVKTKNTWFMRTMCSTFKSLSTRDLKSWSRKTLEVTSPSCSMTKVTLGPPLRCAKDSKLDIFNRINSWKINGPKLRMRKKKYMTDSMLWLM